MRKKIWINIGDIVLGSYRDFEKKPIADIIYKYSPEQAIELKKRNITFGKKDNDIDDEEINEDDIGFTFEDL